jgi:uncharacterized protein YecA (UPF0149 family)
MMRKNCFDTWRMRPHEKEILGSLERKALTLTDDGRKDACPDGVRKKESGNCPPM